MSKIPPCESEIVEFKRNWTEDIKKELVAFANTLGGDLYIGVGDAGALLFKLNCKSSEFCKTVEGQSR